MTQFLILYALFALATPILVVVLYVRYTNLRSRLIAKKVSAFEEALGTNWLQKLGIVLLVLGVASFGIYELAALGSVYSSRRECLLNPCLLPPCF